MYSSHVQWSPITSNPGYLELPNILNLRPHPMDLCQCITVILLWISRTSNISKTRLTQTKFVFPRDTFLTISPPVSQTNTNERKDLDFSHVASKLQASIALLHSYSTNCTFMAHEIFISLRTTLSSTYSVS